MKKKELENYIAKIKPSADAYDYVCKELGIKDNVLEYVKRLKAGRVEPEVKVQIAEKIKEVIREKKDNLQSAHNNDDGYMIKCFEIELEAVEDLLQRLQASNLSA